ncbi:MAG: type I DNA topoisomerase [Patescibacteria group bacterium]
MPKLIIVESPTKAKTISKFLGNSYIVESSFGHLRDLPKSRMGINIEDGSFEPEYINSRDRSAQIKKLKELAKKSSEIIFATDEDREGEAISWHLAHIFNVEPKEAKRIVFHEITKHAIEEALKNPRGIDQQLVDAQQARRILDRLVGYELSPFLWKKVARGLSAGRVQSVAVRLIVEREKERDNFISEEYWTLEANFKKNDYSFTAKLSKKDEKTIKKMDIKNEQQVNEIISELKNVDYLVKQIEKKEIQKNPYPPFTTSTLQQQASNKLGFSAKQTMRIAQQLYEGVKIPGIGQVGLITYMRTDSLNLSEKFITEAGDFINKNFGENYFVKTGRHYKTKSKGAQEAHEAIRPTFADKSPESIKDFLETNQYKLYKLIWNRALASQMTAARLDKTDVDISAGKYTFKLSGQTLVFAGWLSLYPETQKEENLPELKITEKLFCEKLDPKQHFTEAPARYSDASLIKIMEEYGIGRPSTYAPTISTIESRGYVARDENKKLYPKDIAFLVNDLLEKNFEQIVDYKFTAKMEQNLDEIAAGKKHWQPIISTFYHPFHENLTNKMSEMTKEKISQEKELGIDPKTGKVVSIKIGRYGPYVQLGEKTDSEKPKFASIPKDRGMNSIELDEALTFLSLPKNLGKDLLGREIIVNIGRFGPYVQIEKQYFSLKDKDPYSLTLGEALQIVQENTEKNNQKIIKEFADSEIKILNGRFGPYVTDKKINVTVPKKMKPEDLTLAECEELIKNKKTKKTGKK